MKEFWNRMPQALGQ